MAEIQPDAQTLMGFLGSLLFLLIIVEKLKIFFPSKEVPKREVTITTDAASKVEFDEHKEIDREEHAHLHKRIDQSLAEFNDKFQQLPNQIVTLLRNTGVIRDRLDK